MKKVALHNLGCKVNAYETESIQQQFEVSGYTVVPFAPGADIYIINTCTVTNIADRKSRQMLHKAKKMNENAVVVAVGCYVQTAEGKKDPAIDVVIGNNRKKEVVQVVEEYLGTREYTEAVIDINKTSEYEELMVTKTAEHTRAYIKVQDGCNQFCSYCIIPFARGRVRSRSAEDVIDEIKRLAAGGCQEVVLTGIHLSSYGLDFDDPDQNLLTLIQAVHEIAGIKRIRLGSLEPGIITDEFCKAAVRLEKLCPHFHLSLQSGSETVLNRMNRRYTAEEYREKCELLRRYYRKPAITTDIIVGFPGETAEEFEETVKLAENIKFYQTHIFKYSRRKGTKAAEMEGQIPEAVKTERSRILQALHRQNENAYLESFVGEKTEVLLEEKVEINGDICFSGYTKEYIRAMIEATEDLKSNLLTDCQVQKAVKEGFVLCVQDK